VKLLQERISNILQHVNNNFSISTPIAQQLRERTDKWDCIKLKGFCTTKDTVTRLKNQPTDGNKSLLATHLTRYLITKTYRELKKLTPPKINDPMNKWGNKLNKIILKSTNGE
jgi:hypothetical protein